MALISRERSCQGKVRYETKAEAKSRIKRVAGFAGTLRAYRCPYCGYFHIGHPIRNHHKHSWEEG